MAAASWTEPLPWQRGHWEHLAHRLEADRFPHALLLSGVSGLGKRRLARVTAAALLCQRPGTDNLACGKCHSCQVFGGGAHPDFFSVQVEQQHKVIVVEQIRELTRLVALTPQLGARKVACIEAAQRMNENASNALLKTLEEPPAGTFLILVTDVAARLPATVRSRCQSVVVDTPTPARASEWIAAQGGEGDCATALMLAGGAPIRALDLLKGGYLQRRQGYFDQFLAMVRGTVGVLVVAREWSAGAAAEICDMLASWLRDLARWSMVDDPVSLENPDLARELRRMAADVSPGALLQLLEQAQRAAELCDTSAVRQLVFEDLLLECSRRLTAGPAG